MDSALPAEEQAALSRVREAHRREHVQFHALRTRQAAARRFVLLHVLVPGAWTVHEGHRLLERLEAEIRQAVPSVTALTHLEPLDDSVAWDDLTLDRGGTPP